MNYMSSRINSNTLKSEIKAKKLKQADIAKALGLSQGHVSRLINGEIAEDSKAFRLLVKFVYQQDAERSSDGKAILDRLIEDCWDGTVEQANVIDEIVRSAIKLIYLD